MRQTNFTLQEIDQFLNGGKPCSFPRCLLLNELGEMAKAGDAEAEKALRPFLLDAVEENERVVAYCCLGALPQQSAETVTALRTFADNPDNAPVIGWAFEQYEIAPPQVAA
jgi:hypothetical protein